MVRVAITSLLCLMLLLASCARPGHSPTSLPIAPVDDVSHREVESLQAENRRLQAQVADLTAHIKRTEEEVQRQEQDLTTLRGTLSAAVKSPGYESVLRLVYSHLQRGDEDALRFLLPVDGPIEAGIQQSGNSTYKLDQGATELDLRPFIAWVKQHPMDSGSFSVIATMPGYGWAVVGFPDGTHFRVFFSGWQITKILASDKPFDLT